MGPFKVWRFGVLGFGGLGFRALNPKLKPQTLNLNLTMPGPKETALHAEALAGRAAGTFHLPGVSGVFLGY